MKILILASGRGSNARAVMEAAASGKIRAEVCALFSDVADAPALSIAREFSVPARFIDPGRPGARLSPEGEAAYIELPLLYYPGYRAEIDGQAQTVARGTNNMVRVYGLSSGESGTVHVWYQPPTVWLIAQGASVLGALLLAASLRRMRRRA